MDDTARMAPPRNGPSELQFVIENMRQGLWRLDPFGIIQYVNPYLAEWLETSPDKMVGKHFSRYRNLRPVGNNPVEAGLSQRYEAEFSTCSGIPRRAIVVTSPTVDERGEPCGTVDLVTDITAEHAVQAKLVQEVQRMSHLATIDPLTGASNRHVFDQALRELVANAMEVPFGLVIIDVDEFKEVNDEYGHSLGDMVLIEVASRIRATVREGDVVSRFGGDEFAVLLPNASKESLADVVERIRKRLSFRMERNGIGFDITVSTGASHSDDEMEAILQSADRDMYSRKQSKRAKLA